ncbi:MAG: hypothetical protein B7Y82_13550 [Sphingomonadales bacterium 32-65-25]|nr:MAG: hypothetical protein B7Y82_13550 [Sphingomonadales bacterium 32-65-25]OYZ14269.1 MAG: hypothetical protein B7Y35_10885 [Sphingomonadales bacterium 28-64-96]
MLSAMTERPVLSSERLLLRPHRLADFDRLVSLWSHPVVVTHFGGKPFNREDSWNRLLRYAGHWQVMGYGMWAVTRPGEDIHLGDVGFLHAERTGVEPFGCPEAAWAFHPEAQGQGYASEAVACALEWADTRFDRTVAMINPANATSISVARRCGFSIFGEATYKAEPVGLWERLRSSS